MLCSTHNTFQNNIFVRAGKNTVFLWSKVHAVKDSGGLALSKMDWYHYAFSLSQLAKINNSCWVVTEESLVTQTSLEAFFSHWGRPVLAFKQETWFRAHQFINTNPYLTSRASIWYNKKLLIGKKPFM